MSFESGPTQDVLAEGPKQATSSDVSRFESWRDGWGIPRAFDEGREILPIVFVDDAVAILFLRAICARMKRELY